MGGDQYSLVSLSSSASEKTGPSLQTYFSPTLQRPHLPIPHFIRISSDVMMFSSHLSSVLIYRVMYQRIIGLATAFYRWAGNMRSRRIFTNILTYKNLCMTQPYWPDVLPSVLEFERDSPNFQIPIRNKILIDSL